MSSYMSQEEKVDHLFDAISGQLDRQTCNQLHEKFQGDFDLMLNHALDMVSQETSGEPTEEEVDFLKYLRKLNDLDDTISLMELRFSSTNPETAKQDAPDPSKEPYIKVVVNSDTAEDPNLKRSNGQVACQKVVEVLQKKGLQISQNNVCLLNAENDLEFKAFIQNEKDKCLSQVDSKGQTQKDNGLFLPSDLCVFVGDRMVLTLDALQKLDDEKVRLLFSQKEPLTVDQHDEEAMNMNFLEKLLEYSISQFKKIFSSPSCDIDTFELMGEVSPRPAGQERKVMDLRVLYTNWYGRRAPRVLRFTSDSLFRLIVLKPNDTLFGRIDNNESSASASRSQQLQVDVRAVHLYKHIKKIRVLDRWRCVLEYDPIEDGSPPDTYTCSSSALKRLVRVLINSAYPPAIVL